MTALTREGSQSKLPEGVRPVQVNYDDEATLITALTDQDCIIITLAVTTPPGTQSKIIQAAAKAGVRYVIPNAWGCDLTNKSLLNDVPNWNGFREIDEEIEKAGMTRISFVCGFWYEHSFIIEPAFGFDHENKKVTFFDDGTTKMNVSSQPQCGRAVAKLLSLNVFPEDENDQSLTLSKWLNNNVFISSFFINQKDMFESWKRVTGDKDEDWTIEYEPTDERYRKGLERFNAGDRRALINAMYARVFFPSGDGEFEKKHGLDNSVLGLPLEEDLDEKTRNAKDMIDRGYNYMTNRN